MNVDLPRAEPGRWRPLRIGLVDLFYYDIEEFHFHGGNLLLRGNNGTGKSKVLALTMPFLLDGELAPHRVEPDGDRTKRMEWNLLLGGKFEHTERIGYTWMEFGRTDADGSEHFTTIGCGLKAVAGKGIARHWYFVTHQRIGPELSLLTPARTALTRDRLKESIGEHGRVYDRAMDYRRAVDEALFGLGSRYDALVSLLIQLRAPQLTKRPDEKLLSHALTDALPPLDENLIAQVAEAFRGLDDERISLHGLHEVRAAATEFLGLYRRYARAAAKRKATAPRRTHSEYEKLSQQLGAEQRAAIEAELRATAAIERLVELSTLRAQLEARRRSLQESPEARSQTELGQAKERADELARDAAGRQHDLRQADEEASRRSAQVAGASRAAQQAAAAAEDAQAAAGAAAEPARVTVRHRSDVAEAVAASALARAQVAGEEIVRWRWETIIALDSLLHELDAQTATLARARSDEDRCRTDVADSSGAVAIAESATEEAARTLVSALQTYLSGLELVRLEDPATLLSTVEDWATTLDGKYPAARTVHAAADAVSRELAGARANAIRQRDEARRAIARIDVELAELNAGGHASPLVPHTRAADVRAGRPGAPLWRVTDFSAGVAAADRAGIEAALEAAGLLDAWVSPDGTLLRPEDDDIILTARPTSGDGLDGVLVPAINPADEAATALSPAVVARILAGVGYGPQSTMDTWVAADGTFQVGALAGRWRKSAAAYIGEGARQAARVARMAELGEEREFQALVLADEEARIVRADRQLTLVGLERDGLPGAETVRDAHTAARVKREALARAERDLLAAQEQVAVVRRAVETARVAATEFADDVDLPPGRGDLAEVRTALERYASRLAALWPALTARDVASQGLASAQDELVRASERREVVAGRHLEAQERAVAARERYETLESTVGVAVKELQRRLDEVIDELAARDRAETKARQEEKAALAEQNQSTGRIGQLRESLSMMEKQRLAAIETLRSFATTGLLRLACPDVEIPDPATEWPPTPAITTARAIDRELGDVDDGDRRWELDQQAVNHGHKVLADGLSRHGHRAALSVRDDAMVVEVTFQGRTQQVVDLNDALDDEIAQRERILSARHREILENQLVSEVAASLQELISAAEVHVADMNRELAARPTSTGMKLRLVWRPAATAPPGLAALRDKLLRQSADVWSDDDRGRLGDFLEGQIAAERLRDSSATWVEQLTNALDYRSWHEFAIQRHQDGQWRPATGPASGGERVLAASVPLFAAASSYYASSGNPKAPRLIALDEAFAGVDDDSRAKCLGLLANFDLDVMMTSEREWGCYPEVPGLAIAQLARRDGIDAVLVTPWRWDGNVRAAVPRPEPYVPSSSAPEPLVPATDPALSQPDLFT